MLATKMDTQKLADVPVKQLSRFLRFIAEHDLWEELEQQLRDQGCRSLKMSWEPIHVIATIAEAKAADLAAAEDGLGRGHATSMRCASNGTGRPGPNTPTRPTDGGTR